VHADPEQLDQILEQLVENAAEAMPDGGRLVVSARAVRLSPENGNRGVEGDFAEIVVRDVGVGMTRSAVKKAFEPFYSTKLPRGRGLGLSSVYGIVRQSGGSVTLDSAPNEGTTVRVMFPAFAPVARVEPTPSMFAPPARAETILVVDDEEVVRTLTAQVLRRHGFSVIEAENGRVAEERARATTRRIDLLLTDVMMPGALGPEVAMTLCALRPEMRVLFMSGYTEDSQMLVALRERRLELLRKPFTPESLVARVVAVLAEEDPAPLSFAGFPAPSTRR
jgi:CheY-like chemotaxis protein